MTRDELQKDMERLAEQAERFVHLLDLALSVGATIGWLRVNKAGGGNQGSQGEQGERGERGLAGLSVPVRRALVFLFVLNVGLAASNLLWTAHEVQAGNRSRCSTVVADATIPLPPGPAREWEAAFEAIARQRAQQLHCGT